MKNLNYSRQRPQSLTIRSCGCTAENEKLCQKQQEFNVMRQEDFKDLGGRIKGNGETTELQDTVKWQNTCFTCGGVREIRLYHRQFNGRSNGCMQKGLSYDLWSLPTKETQVAGTKTPLSSGTPGQLPQGSVNSTGMNRRTVWLSRSASYVQMQQANQGQVKPSGTR